MWDLPNKRFISHKSLIFLMLIFCLQFTILPTAVADSDTYPTPWRAPTTQDTVLDTWKEWNRECTSYAAWMLHSINGYEMPFNDDADNWGTDASNLHIEVNMVPVVGSVFWQTGSKGDHVAYVESIPDSTHVQIEEYNALVPFGWDEQTVPTNSASGYIHFKDLSSAPYTTFQSNNDNLLYSWQSGISNDLMQGMATNTNPSSAKLADGSYETAFQANTGDLFVYNSSTETATDTHQVVMGGTSPAITAFSGGGWEVAFQAASDGNLHTYDSGGVVVNTLQGMRSGTSPAITSLASDGWRVVFQANTDHLFVWSVLPGSGSSSTDLGQPMAASTNPSITAVSGSTWEAAYQASDGNLHLYNSASGAFGLNLGVKSGSSPAITTLPTTTTVNVALETNLSNLYLYSSATGATNLNQGISGSTSPSITGLTSDSYQISFQALTNEHYLYTFDSSSGPTNTNQGMASTTSPAMAN